MLWDKYYYYFTDKKADTKQYNQDLIASKW